MRLKAINTALVLTFGTFGGVTAVWADTVSGSYNVYTQVFTTYPTLPGQTFASTGSEFSATSPTSPFFQSPGGPMLNNSNFASVSGSLNQRDMYASAAAGALGSNGEGLGFGESQVTYSTTITNSTSSSQSYSFNFLIDGGQVQTVDGITGQDHEYASTGATIAIDGQTVWFTAAQLCTGAGIACIAPGGVDIGYTTTQQGSFEQISFGNYSGAYSFQVGAGQSETLTYTLDARTSYNRAPFANQFAADWYGGAYAQIGDPFALGGTGGAPRFNVVQTSVSAVPEPETGAMLAAGIALMAGIARRRKQRTQA